MANSRIVQGNEEVGSPLDAVMRFVLSLWKAGDAAATVTDQQLINQQYACKMVESILAHHKGRVDHLIPLLFQMTTGPLLHLSEQKGNRYAPLVLGLLDVLSALCMYAPAGFVQQVEGQGLTQRVFNVWMSYIDHQVMTTSFHHQRMSMIALSHLVSLGPSALPPLLREALPTVLTLQVKRLGGMIELYKIAEEEEKAEEEWDPDEEDDEYDGGAWDDDDVEGEEGGGEDGGKEEAMGEEDEKTGDGEDDLKTWEDIAAEHDQNQVDEAHFPSPIDEVDEFVAFEKAMEALKEKDAVFYGKYQLSVQREAKVRVVYEAVMAKAEEQRKRELEDEQEDNEEEAVA